MAARTVTKMTTLASEAASFAPWGAPAALVAGWMVWPGLTQSFKEETLGLSSSTPSAAPAATPKASPAVAAMFSPTGKYKYVRGEIGEAPTLEED